MYSINKRLIVAVLLVALVADVSLAQCLNGCSNRGICINNACVCAEGLTGSDCSQRAASSRPTLYQCPECYSVTVGPATYISGPSWRLPDGPIVGLNYKGNLSVYQGNGNGEMISSGTSISDYLTSPIIALTKGTDFDSCGSWIMRALTTSSGKVLGFYHAETACIYSNNGQTKKSIGYSISMDGGKSFTKPNYPNNVISNTKTGVTIGKPSGEGDFSVVVRDGYYYLFFANVETWHTGVARATVASDAVPGSFFKYLNGQWNSPAVGGDSSRLNDVAGTQVYLHTPSNNFVSVGNYNPYWFQGFSMSVSDDALNWKYMADPIFTPDPSTNLDTIMYPSFLGPTGGYDIGSSFKLYYMWVKPYDDWTHRYQISKDITLTYVGPNSTAPSAKIALSTYRNPTNGETWQTTELADSPYVAVDIVGYLMSRPYPYTFVVYDCLNYTTDDHFVGTADECFNSGTGVDVSRTLGHMWSTRVAKSIALYRCWATGGDTFLSASANCEGRAPAQTVPFGYVQDGPAFTLKEETLIFQGSNWKFSAAAPVASWTAPAFDDSRWAISATPFGSSYSTAKSFFGNSNYYFRYNFNVPAGRSVSKLMMSVSSDDTAVVYLNGVLVDQDPAIHHEASYWNRRVFISTASLVAGQNVLAVLTKNADAWAYFDLQLVATYNTQAAKRSISEEQAEVVSEELKKPVREVREVPQYTRAAVQERADVSQTLLPQGSVWSYFYGGVPMTSWTSRSFDDSAWPTAAAPFVTGYSAYTGKTPFTATDYYFRHDLTVPFGKSVQAMTISVASDNSAVVYVNGELVDTDPAPWHQAVYWNRQIQVDGSKLSAGSNVIAVLTKNQDQWAFFDAQVTVTYAAAASTARPTSAPSVQATTKPTASSTVTLIEKSSRWSYSTSSPASGWTALAFNDASWPVSAAPFVTGYSAFAGVGTPFANTDYYFRSRFTIPSGRSVQGLKFYIASDNFAIVYVNGVQVDSDPMAWHEAIYWNRQVNVDVNLVRAGSNVIAVLVKNQDQWAFFDLRLDAVLDEVEDDSSSTIAPVATVAPTVAPTIAPPPAAPTTRPSIAIPTTCGIKGQMIAGVCVCDAGWGGSDCNTNLCTYTGAVRQTVVSSGSTFRHVAWPETSSTPLGWFGNDFDDTWWQLAAAPFGSSYVASLPKATLIDKTRHLYRKKFLIDVPFNMNIQNATLSVSSEDVHRVWVNGKFVDSPIYPYQPHTAKKWNTVLTLDASLFSDVNNIAVEVPLVDGRWMTYFDMQLDVSFSTKTCRQ